MLDGNVTILEVPNHCPDPAPALTRLTSVLPRFGSPPGSAQCTRIGTDAT